MAEHHDAAVHHHWSADDQYRETPPGAEYEHTDANVWMIVKFGIWLTVSAIIIHVGLGFMFSMLKQQATKTQVNEYPLASAAETRLPPAPRLQQFPRNEMYEFRLGQEEKLHSYGWVNKDAGTVHIPIEQAMQMVIQRGVQSRAPEPSAPAETPGLMPSDSSSGRVMERRLQ
jgi:hypothetical protein